MDREFMDQLFVDIQEVREYQDRIWGDDLDDKHTMNDWVVFVNRYLAKAVPELEPVEPGHLEESITSVFRRNMIKAAAIIFAALEALERNGGLPLRHYD